MHRNQSNSAYVLKLLLCVTENDSFSRDLHLLFDDITVEICHEAFCLPSHRNFLDIPSTVKLIANRNCSFFPFLTSLFLTFIYSRGLHKHTLDLCAFISFHNELTFMHNFISLLPPKCKIIALLKS